MSILNLDLFKYKNLTSTFKDKLLKMLCKLKTICFCASTGILTSDSGEYKIVINYQKIIKLS